MSGAARSGVTGVVEYDLEGREVWSVKARSAWSAIRLKNGNTLIAGDAAKYVREVNHKGETVWELIQADVPDIKLFNTQTANRLANGNTVICNWCARDNNTAHWAGTVQVFEVTPEKKVVWALSSWKAPDLGPPRPSSSSTSRARRRTRSGKAIDPGRNAQGAACHHSRSQVMKVPRVPSHRAAGHL